MDEKQRLPAPCLMIDHVPERGVKHLCGEDGRGDRFRQRRFSGRPKRVFERKKERSGESRSETDTYEFLVFFAEHFHRLREL